MNRKQIDGFKSQNTPPIQYTSCFAVSFLENTRKCSNIYLLRYSFFKREKNKIKRDNFISIMVGHPAMAILFKIYIQMLY